jgi:5-carboxymethyl-2-hydroxymuconate isomerase
MPHIVITYTPNLESKSDFSVLCRSLADAMLSVNEHHQESGKPIFQVGGTRVFALPAAHFAVADGQAPTGKEFGFVYVYMRMAKGRTSQVHDAVGLAVGEALKAHFAPLIARHLVGITFQIDEGHEVFDLKYSSLHPYFNPVVTPVGLT